MMGGGVGGVVGVIWSATSSVRAFSGGRRKEGTLALIEMAGAAMSTAGLCMMSTGVGAIPGAAVEIVGLVIWGLAFCANEFDWWTNTYEKNSHNRYKNPLDGLHPGMDELKVWLEEREASKVCWDFDAFPLREAEALTERVDEFLSNVDTFDHFQKED